MVEMSWVTQRLCPANSYCCFPDAWLSNLHNDVDSRAPAAAHLSPRCSAALLSVNYLSKHVDKTLRFSLGQSTDIGRAMGWKGLSDAVKGLSVNPAFSLCIGDSRGKNLASRWKLSSVSDFNICGFSTKCQKNWPLGDVPIFHLLLPETFQDEWVAESTANSAQQT